MRTLAILLVACSSSSSTKPAPVPDPAVTTRCPVGDGTNVEVYGFLAREIADAGGDRATTKQRLAEEAALLKDKTMKPQRSSVVETETSHVLTTLCAGTPGCRAIGLYDRGGFAIALSSHRAYVAPLGFADDKRWAQLTGASGMPVEAAGELSPGVVWVTFPTSGGLAACVVDN